MVSPTLWKRFQKNEEDSINRRSVSMGYTISVASTVQLSGFGSGSGSGLENSDMPF